jgi:hypothetical protein
LGRRQRPLLPGKSAGARALDEDQRDRRGRSLRALPGKDAQRQSRFREDVETNVALARCRTPSDALDCQRRFTERATAQYIEAANKLADVMTKTAREGLVSMSAAANEGAQPQRAAKA